MHLAQHIRCPAVVAYAFARDPVNLPVWAAGLGGSFAEVDGQWRMSTPQGDVVLEFVAANEHGVLDHAVVLPDGTRMLNPMRALPDGDDECEVVFTLRRRPEMTDDDLARDAAAVTGDLRALKQVLESVERQS